MSWFAAFLAHFIRDDGNPPAEVVRGVVGLPDIVAALRHEYTSPDQQVPEVMALVCRLELCVELSALEHTPAASAPASSAPSPEAAYLFPCLLPAATAQDVAAHWPGCAGSADRADAATATAATTDPVIRGHRFRSTSGFLPPGLFPTLLARLARLPTGSVHASRLWRDAAVLHLRRARVLLRVDVAAATLDLIAAAPSDAWMCVEAANGTSEPPTLTLALALTLASHPCPRQVCRRGQGAGEQRALARAPDQAVPRLHVRPPPLRRGVAVPQRRVPRPPRVLWRRIPS